MMNNQAVTAMLQSIKLKVQIFPAFMNECELEFKNGQLLIIRSALPEKNDPGEVYTAKSEDSETIEPLVSLLSEIIEKPAKKDFVTISDGLFLKTQMTINHETVEHTIESIQDNSKEKKFVELLFTFASDIIKNEILTDYLNEVKKQYL